MKRKIGLLFIAVYAVSLLIISCNPQSPFPEGEDGSGNNSQVIQQGSSDQTDANQGSTDLKEFKFKISQLPYGSEGLKIVARVQTGKTHTDYDLAKVTSCTADAFIEKSIQLPKTYDQLWLFFVDDKKVDKYYIRVQDSQLDVQTGIYNINGYYYYYYVSDPYNLPYAAINECMFRELELYKEYTLDYKKAPFIVGYLKGVKGRSIKIKINENKTPGEDKDNTDTDCRVSLDKTQIMSYSSECEYLFGDMDYSTYLCEEDPVYVLVKPHIYDFSLEDGKTDVTLMFTLDIPKEDRCLTIEKSCFASDNFLYASGKYYQNDSLKNLYKIDPKLNERVLVCEFTGDITSICEPEQGKLLVSYIIEDEQEQQSTNVAKIDLESGEHTDITTGFEKKIDSFILYKNNQVVLSTKNFKDTQDFAYLLNYKTGEYTAAPEKCFGSFHHNTEDACYVSEYDLIIYSLKNTSPRDIAFLRIVNSDDNGPQVYGTDSQYHTEYEMHYPFRLYSTNPLEFINADGNIFTVRTDFINSIEPVDEQTLGGEAYYNKVKEWCEFSRSLNFTYTDFIACSEYFYIMKLEEVSSIYNNTIVEKHSFAEPEAVIESITFEKEDGIKFWQCGEKLYLQATYWDYPFGYSKKQDMISFHEINF